MGKFKVLPGDYTVSKLPPKSAVPDWVASGSFYFIGHTPHELSIVCETGVVPQDMLAERGWRVLELQGPFPFSLTGVLSSFLRPLADAGVPIFALSTFDTDYVLVPAHRLEDAVHALRSDSQWECI